MAGERTALLVLVPDLMWRDAPPALATFAKASLSVRAAPAESDAADGYLTVAKGARSGAPPDGIGPVVEHPDGSWRLAAWPRLRGHDRRLHYGGELGALGTALRRSAKTWVLVTNDRRAAAAAADTDGVVPKGVAGGAEAVPGVLADGANAVIVAVPGEELAAVLEAGSGARCVVVASVSTPDLEHLGVFATSPGCGFGANGLTSPSTHQPRLVTLPDVAPTFLAALGIPAPKPMAGFTVERSGDAAVSGLIERDRRASVADRVRTPLVWLFVGLHAIAAVVVLTAPRLRRSATLAVLSVPPASFVAMAAPWWRWGFLGAVVTGGVIAMALGTLASTIARDDSSAAIAFVVAATGAIIALDNLFGGPLQIDAPFGNSPVRGGRYFGLGNVGFAFLSASLLVGAAFARDRWGAGARPWVLAIFLAGAAVIGAPWFGADAGGVVVAVCAFGVFVLGWDAGGLTFRRLAAVVAVACVAVVGFAVVDVMRPERSRTHLGRALTGNDDAAGVIARKGSRALATLNAPLTNVLWIGSLTLLLARPRLTGRPGLRAGTWGILSLAVLGSALNDSGLQVGGGVAAIVWPAYIVLGQASPSSAPP
ncbi:MAG TPA: hypothetical protein VHF24_08545 [Acidimicrobiales bacterium]|nr:hypothetical protein [Acidimicrobiales bacterium]